MIKRFGIVVLLFVISIAAFALPAKRGVYKTITLADGTEVRAELCGDEHVHYWQTEDGRQFVQNAETKTFDAVNAADLVSQYGIAENAEAKGMRKAAGVQPTSPIVGDRKGIIILVQFSDVKFQDGHDVDFYTNIANTKNFTNSEGYVGSVRDYFYDQSDGQLDYTFDVYGPVTLANTQAYYGGNSSYGNDKNMKSFVQQSLASVKSQVDFSKYDNDGDKWVDNVFFIYAGNGEADTGNEDCIWPHMYYYYDGYGAYFSQNGVRVNVYACSMEIQSDGKSGGIGAICHEFSHCLGLPDMYDTANNSSSGNSSGNYGNSWWDIMNTGCYLGDCFRPCGYNAYERDYCGWRSIKELTDDATYDNLTGIADGGKAYKMTNPGNENEYFIIEPRSKSGWDRNLFNDGLLVYHVDYDASAWRTNVVNNTSGHQRMAIIPADNNTSISSDAIAGDAYPYGIFNVIADNTTPSTALFNNNIDGTKNLGKSVYDMKRNSDGTFAFSYMNGTYVYDNNAPEGSLFYESFGRCAGNGGNDGVFSGSVGLETFVADNDGWVAANKFAADKCAKFGTNRQNGMATTPTFTINGPATITFKAATYGSECPTVKLSATGDATLSDTSFTMVRDNWVDCSSVINGTGEVTLKFTGTKRWFLDEVLVMPGADGIENVTFTNAQNDGSTYNLSGQKVNSSYKGVVIKSGKKVLR